VDILLVGCNSHRLNLAVTHYLGLKWSKEEDVKSKCTEEQYSRRKVLFKVSSVMSKMKTVKGSAHLREYTNLHALKANATRWDGNYRMLERFLVISNAVVSIAKKKGKFSVS